jgi:hypothetical protein
MRVEINQGTFDQFHLTPRAGPLLTALGVEQDFVPGQQFRQGQCSVVGLDAQATCLSHGFNTQLNWIGHKLTRERRGFTLNTQTNSDWIP